MFAVPGWNLSVKSPIQQQSKSAKQNAGSENKTTKKSKFSKTEFDDGNGTKSSQRTPKPSGERRETYTRDNKHRDSQDGRRDKHEKVRENSNKVKNIGTRHASSTDTTPGTKRKREDEQNSTSKAQRISATLAHPPPPPPSTSLTPLQAKMRSKLTSARFRHLNETLYTTDSSSAMTLFTTSPDLFAEYHAGFAQQVKDSWPQNPVDNYITAIKTRGALSEPDSKTSQIPLPRRKTGSCTIADLGCGDAPLARGCQAQTKSLQLKFHNYDLHTPNDFVTKADIANLPLRDGEADIVVFCLSLMGTNWLSFVEEAWRVLRGDGKGEVWVAEVKSRFGRPGAGVKGRVVENSVGKRRKTPQKSSSARDNDNDGEGGDERFAEDSRTAEDEAGDETDISGFVKVFSRRGFQLKPESVVKKNKMFVSMVFVKSGIPTAGKHKGLKWTGREYQRQEDKPKPSKTWISNNQSARRRGSDDEDVSPEEEGKVLKPCVYKTR